MSIDRGTLGFLEALHRDPALLADLDAAIERADDPRQATIEFASRNGFDATADGLDAAKAAVAAAAELSDEELETVAGGFNPQPEPPKPSPFDRAFDVRTLLGSRLFRW
ncbi:MAG: Nif11-like leader peptide family natural product precursor [Ectothiorhodospiraceae bacterium]|nr:Nif11-like leader peptide family natural product precursor [Chromatiales bacterium]MCP5154818.1 Nif11-like leader peptide family natural product precursor [Ectothiorhodospiraceae bacterium]